MFDTVKDVISCIAGPDTRVVICDCSIVPDNVEGPYWHPSVVALSDRSVLTFSYRLCNDTLYIDVR